jgi:hypothetical protein
MARSIHHDLRDFFFLHFRWTFLQSLIYSILLVFEYTELLQVIAPTLISHIITKEFSSLLGPSFAIIGRDCEWAVLLATGICLNAIREI